MTTSIAALGILAWQRLFFADDVAQAAFRPPQRSERDAILSGTNVPAARVVVVSAQDTLGRNLYPSERENVLGKLHWLLVAARICGRHVR